MVGGSSARYCFRVDSSMVFSCILEAVSVKDRGNARASGLDVWRVVCPMTERREKRGGMPLLPRVSRAPPAACASQRLCLSGIAEEPTFITCGEGMAHRGGLLHSEVFPSSPIKYRRHHTAWSCSCLGMYCFVRDWPNCPCCRIPGTEVRFADTFANKTDNAPQDTNKHEVTANNGGKVRVV